MPAGRITAALAVVRNQVLGTELPDWVSAEWREPAFVDWLTKVYLNPEFRWKGNGQYTTTSARRQVVLSIAARLERFTLDDIAAVVPIDSVYSYAILRQDVLRGTNKSRPWLHCVVDPGGRKWGELAAFSGVRCSCGEVATVVMRVPEVPRDLLCSCLRMPEAEQFEAPGMDPAMRFPREYLDMQLPWEQCIEELRQSYERAQAVLRRSEARVLGYWNLLSNGVSEPALNKAMGLSGGGRNTVRLLNLRYLGFLERDDSTRPATWRYTPEGRERAEALLRGEVALQKKGSALVTDPEG